MEKSNKSSLYPVVFMVVLSFILTFLLAALNEFTAPRTQLNQELDIQTKILDVFQIQPESEDPEAIISTFDEYVETSEYEGAPLYIYNDNGEEKAYAVPFEGPGLWGTIRGYVGVSSDFSTITGIQFTEQSETPGLGARIEDEEYRSQYRDLDISSASPGQIIQSGSGGNVDIISGATQTSNAVVDMVNDDLTRFIESAGGGN